MVDDEALDAAPVHQTTLWTASVCTGALILGAAGILKGLPATTHWYKMGVLRIIGANPQPDQRIVHSGRIITGAAVSEGSIWRFGWAGESPVASGPKQFSWRSSKLRIRHSTAAT